jgi:hypothetical protein
MADMEAPDRFNAEVRTFLKSVQNWPTTGVQDAYEFLHLVRLEQREVTVMHPNEAHLRESYEALERGDWEAVGETLADDFLLAVAGRNPLAGETRGRDANIARQQRMLAGVADLLDAILAAWD